MDTTVLSIRMIIQAKVTIILIGTFLAMLLFSGTIITLLVFVIIAYHRHKLHYWKEETPQGIVMCFDFPIGDVVFYYSCL